MQPLDYWDDPTIAADVKATLTNAEKIKWATFGGMLGLLLGLASAPTMIAILARLGGAS